RRHSRGGRKGLSPGRRDTAARGRAVGRRRGGRFRRRPGRGPMTSFLFAAPYAGLVLLALLVLLVLHLARGRVRRASLVFPLTSPFRAMPPGLAVRLRHVRVTLRVLGLLLLVVAFARPQTGRHEEE